MYLFTIIDPKTGNSVLGIENVPSDHAQMLMLSPPKSWDEFELHEKLPCKALKGEMYYVLRTQ